jgi:hypothetical protein
MAENCYAVICAECHYAVICAECHYAECSYAECHYAECDYAQCLGALPTNVDHLTIHKTILAKSNIC